jgi:hypothetical protein
MTAWKRALRGLAVPALVLTLGGCGHSAAPDAGRPTPSPAATAATGQARDGGAAQTPQPGATGTAMPETPAAAAEPPHPSP